LSNDVCSVLTLYVFAEGSEVYNLAEQNLRNIENKAMDTTFKIEQL
jgi:hypothetical protein